MFIPPPGFYFRLVDINEYVLFSRITQEPQVGHFKGPKYDDQLFSLIYGGGSREGTYAIKGKATGYVLYSRNSPEPRVGHIGGDGKYDDNWFQFPEESGTYAGKFRILCPANQLVWVSRTHAEPQVSNNPAAEVYSDQFFSFAFDDVVVKKIEYNTSLGRIVDRTTITLADQTLTNTTDKEQELSFTFTESVKQTSTFQYSDGFPIATGTEINTGIPSVIKGNIQVNGSEANVWHFASEESFTKTYGTASILIKAGPGQSVRAVFTVQRGTLEVPYTITLVQNNSGVETQMTGTWKGLSTWNLHYEVDVH